MNILTTNSIANHEILVISYPISLKTHINTLKSNKIIEQQYKETKPTIQLPITNIFSTKYKISEHKNLFEHFFFTSCVM